MNRAERPDRPDPASPLSEAAATPDTTDELAPRDPGTPAPAHADIPVEDVAAASADTPAADAPADTSAPAAQAAFAGALPPVRAPLAERLRTAHRATRPRHGAADPDGLGRLVQSRRPIRVVGAPPLPEPVQEPADIALRRLAIAGVSRRRMGWLAGFVISVWIVAVFARQVGDASAAASRADQVRQDNAALAAQVAALQHERDLVQQRSFIEFQARGFGLGSAKDQRFTLAQNAPTLPPGAPGSASVRLAPESSPATPLDTWLALLFGPSR